MLNFSLLVQFLISGIGSGCVYGLVGIGLSLIYSSSGIVNFSQGAFVMLGGMLTYFLLNDAQLSMIVAAPVVIVVVGGVGALIERLIVRPLWKRKAAMFVVILATLAAQIVIEQVVLLALGDQPRSFPNFAAWPPLKLGGVAVNYQVIWIVIGSLSLVGLLLLFFSFTRTGRAMRACAVNAESAALLGVPVTRMLSYAFALSGAMGALAGVMITPTQYTSFNISTSFGINGFIAAVIGGIGNPFGAFVGGLFLGIVQSFAIVFLGAGYGNIVALSLLLLCLAIRPEGLLGIARG